MGEYSFDTVAVCAKILIKEMTEMEEKETVTQRGGWSSSSGLLWK